MQPDPFGKHAIDDDRLAAEAIRKATSCKSELSGRMVCNSSQDFTLSGVLMPGVKVTFGIKSPPQIDNQRIYLLALFHIKAFFYLLTYSPERQMGFFWPGGFFPLNTANHKDWGNTHQTFFMKTVLSWDFRLIGDFANGFFKACIRKHPQQQYWSWALEWNNSCRVIGFFGDIEAVNQILKEFPPIIRKTIHKSTKETIICTEEIPLNSNEDILFQV